MKTILKTIVLLSAVLLSFTAFGAKITDPAHDVSTYCATTSPDFPWANDDCIAAYTNVQSVNVGSSIAFKVHTNPVQQFNVDIYRVGWDGTSDSTWVMGVTGKAGKKQPNCPMDTVTGEVACSWSTNYTLAVPKTWKSGVYLAILSNATGWNTEVLFVVRDDAKVADFTYVVPTNTYAVYNNYPRWSTLTGKSMYDADSTGANTVVGTPRAVRVSYDRPQHHQFGSWAGTDWNEFHLVKWLEQNNYNVKYITDVDFNNITKANLIKNKGIIFGGHTEYWTKGMYDNAVLARDSGVSLAFFGANTAHWQVRYASSAGGTAKRGIICYKDSLTSNIDPNTNAALETKHWRDLGRPEQTLVGVQYFIAQDNTVSSWNYESVAHTPLVISDTNSWAFNYTSLTVGSSIPLLTGYEVDMLDPFYTAPTVKAGTSQLLFTKSPFVTANGPTVYQQSSLYQAPSGAWVFGAGTISYSFALGKDADGSTVYQDANIKQLTKNILDKFITK